MPDRLDHLDRHQFVERAGEVAIVVEEHRNTVLQAAFGHGVDRVLKLLPGDGSGGDPTAIVLGRINCHAAPARANLYQMILGLKLKILADQMQLML